MPWMKRKTKKKQIQFCILLGVLLLLLLCFFFVARFGCFIIYDYYVLWLCFESSYGNVRVGYGAWLVGEAKWHWQRTQRNQWSKSIFGWDIESHCQQQKHNLPSVNIRNGFFLPLPRHLHPIQFARLRSSSGTCFVLSANWPSVGRQIYYKRLNQSFSVALGKPPDQGRSVNIVAIALCTIPWPLSNNKSNYELWEICYECVWWPRQSVNTACAGYVLLFISHPAVFNGFILYENNCGYYYTSDIYYVN